MTESIDRPAGGPVACRTVLFDLDQTLTDRPRSFARAARTFAERFGPRFGDRPADVICEMMVRFDGGGYTPRSSFFAQLEDALGWKGCAPLLEAYWEEEYPECTVAVDDAVPVLDALAGRGLRLGIITNGHTSAQNRKVDTLGLRERMACVVVSETVGVKKPDPAIFRLALDAIGADAAETVYVGDHPRNDVVGARGAGILPVWIEGHFEWPVDQPAPRHTIRSLSGLLDVLGIGGDGRSGT